MMNRLAVLGFPVGHSRSPSMHNAAFAELGMAGEWSYAAIEVSPDELAERAGAMPGEGFVGANVTVPHKEAALALADEISETAREIGAANTLSFEGGSVRADNTDGDGLLRALPSSPAGKRALVLGAGGAARAVVWALLREGAEVDVWNRTALSARHLCEELGGEPVPDLDPQREYGIVVNSTSVGLQGEDAFVELPLGPLDIHEEQVVVDMVYGAEPTTLLRTAAGAGATTVDGIEILVQQGALSFQLWTGREAPIETMRAAARS
jgi:shikimate dehydrogenase